MRQSIVILCLFAFCLALFVVASHEDADAGGTPNRTCSVCILATQLPYCADDADVQCCQSWIKFKDSNEHIVLPEVPATCIEERGPPCEYWTGNRYFSYARITLLEASSSNLDDRAPPAKLSDHSIAFPKK